MIELAYFANPPASKVSPSDAPLTHGLLVPMLIPSTTIPLYRLTMHECPSTVRAISESGGRFPGKFAGGPSRRPHCPNGHHDIDLQIGGFGHPRRGVHVLRRHHRLLCGHHLQLGLHRERSRLKRRMNAPSLLPHPKNKSAPRAVACEAESVLLTALGKGRKNKISCSPWCQSSFHRTTDERRTPKPGRTQLPATLPAPDFARSASPPAPQQAIRTRS